MAYLDSNWDHVSNEKLKIQNLRIVLSELTPVRAKWEGFCIQLGMDPNKVAEIDRTQRGNPELCLQEAMASYLKSPELHPSWRNICVAVASPAGGQDRSLAYSIAENHKNTVNPSRAKHPHYQQSAEDQIPAKKIKQESSFSSNNRLDDTVTMKELGNLEYTDKNHRKKSLHIIEQFSADWKRVGYQLNFGPADIDDIESTYRHVCTDCCSKLMQKWLAVHNEDTTPKTWRTLVQALRAVRRHALADEIEEAILQIPTVPKAGILSVQEITSHPTSSYTLSEMGTGQTQALSRPLQQGSETVDGIEDNTPPPPPPLPPVDYSELFQTATEEEKESLLKDVAVLLLVVNDNELEGVIRYLKPLPEKPKIMKVNTDEVRFKIGMYGKAVTAVVQTRSGLNNALELTRQALKLINPKKVISVGVACGRSPDKQKLADVLVCEIAHDFSKEKIRRGKVIVDDVPRKKSSEKLVHVFMDWHGWKRSRSENNDDLCKVHIGPMISKSTLIDDPDIKKMYFDAVPGAIGAEMEGIGIYTAAEEACVDHILVKAISDWGDGNKTKDWQPFAADVAAHYVHHHLK